MSSLVRRLQRTFMPGLKPRQTLSPQPNRKDKPAHPKRAGAPRGRRRGKRSAKWLAARAERRAA